MKLFKVIKEMVGRIEINPLRIIFNRFKNNIPTITRANYSFARDVYKATAKGYELGAIFAKPIVNTAAAFLMGKTPTVKSDDSKLEEILNTELYNNNKAKLFRTVQREFRDGDCYVRLRPETKKILTFTKRYVAYEFIPPQNVEIITGEDGEIDHYDITWTYTDLLTGKQKIQTEKVYADRYEFYKGYSNVSYKTIYHKLGIIPIIHFANECDEEDLYGTPECEGCYTLFKKYNEVADSAVNAQKYHGRPTPFIKGIKNIKEFMDSNFKKNKNGEYQTTWDPDQMMILGEGADMAFLQSSNPTGDGEMMLKMLFYSICIQSETPEFVMGTHIKSSNASVEQQLHPVIKKTQRKQLQFNDVLQELNAKYAIVYMSLFSKKFKTLDTTIVWPDIIDKDQKLTIEIIEKLKDLGLITDKTALILADVVENAEEEVQKAQKEKLKKLKSLRNIDNENDKDSKIINDIDPDED